MRARTEPDGGREDRFWAVFESASAPMMVVDDSRRYVAVNDAACELVGLPRERLLEMRIDDLTPRERRAHVPGVWHAFVREGFQSANYDLVRPDGRSVAVQYSATANVLPGRHLTIFVRSSGPGAGESGAGAVLTPREREVLRLIAMGHTSAQIGERLGIAVKTVGGHTENILHKLGARTRAQATAVALRGGQLAPPDQG